MNSQLIHHFTASMAKMQSMLLKKYIGGLLTPISSTTCHSSLAQQSPKWDRADRAEQSLTRGKICGKKNQR